MIETAEKYTGYSFDPNQGVAIFQRRKQAYKQKCRTIFVFPDILRNLPKIQIFNAAHDT